MSLGIRSGEEVLVQVEGDAEVETAAELQKIVESAE